MVTVGVHSLMALWAGRVCGQGASVDVPMLLKNVVTSLALSMHAAGNGMSHAALRSDSLFSHVAPFLGLRAAARWALYSCAPACKTEEEGVGDTQWELH